MFGLTSSREFQRCHRPMRGLQRARSTHLQRQRVARKLRSRSYRDRQRVDSWTGIPDESNAYEEPLTLEPDRSPGAGTAESTAHSYQSMPILKPNPRPSEHCVFSGVPASGQAPEPLAKSHGIAGAGPCRPAQLNSESETAGKIQAERFNWVLPGLSSLVR
jgi:hypothetical protein